MAKGLTGVVILRGVIVSGRAYSPGETCALSAGDAEYLIRSGKAELLPPAPAPSKVAELPENDRVSFLVGIIRGMDPDDKALWTKDGKPDAGVLSARAGFQVTAQLRDQATEQLMAEDLRKGGVK